MASWQSRIARFVVRITVRRSMEKHADSLPDLCRATRKALEAGDARTSRVPKDVTIVPVASGEMRGEWVVPNGVAIANRAVLYMHGGAMVAGTAAGYRGLITIALARKMGIAVFAVDYRRAPEHRYPAQLDDCIAAYRTMREKIPAEGIIFAGDSAGGNLVLATLLALRERDAVARPCAGVIALSPWTDLAATGASATENAASDDMLAPQTESGNIALAYTDASAFTNPLVSPLYGDYTGSPPILLFASTIEMLRDDSVRLAEKLRASGVDVTLELVADMPHVWPVIGMLPETKAAMVLMAAFAARAWATAAPAEPPAVTI